ncbi:hypothetical protein N9V20_01275 [Candidatus Poseidoniales archaeon]|nr:hypothetical protein [Candidatus Poseidoniales archaeon]
MNKKTPMILVAMLLLSLMASIDMAELQETTDVEETSARSGADAEVIAITSPKETTCTDAGCRNTLKAGDSTNFEAFIKNSGDIDIIEMSYTVSVYLSDGDGNPTLLAKDAGGNDLRWENTGVVCGNANFCDFPSLAQGDILGGAKYILQYAGNPIEWTPVVGYYIVEVIVNTPSDADAGNNAQTIEVSVEDWYDIQVDLSWDTGAVAETGPGAKDWTLAVTANGSSTFDPRDVTIRLKSSGDVTALQDDDGTDLLAGPDPWYDLVVGTPTTVETFTNVSTEPPTTLNGTRNVLSYLTTYTYSGSLAFNAEADEASYGLAAQLLSYTQYAQWNSCEEIDSTTNETLEHLCEEELTQDSYSSTDSDEILGSAATFHDIGIVRMSVAQGYNLDGSGVPTNIMSDDSIEDLNVGVSYFQVEVEHRGSDPMVNYDWNVTLSLTDSEGIVSSVVANSCESGIEPYYTHSELGAAPYDSSGDGNIDMDGEMSGFACTMIDLGAGEHTFAASLTLDGKVNDARPSNNERSITVDVRNNNPIILSVDSLSDGELFLGQTAPLRLTAAVFDVDDPSASGLEYSWSSAGVELMGCERSSQSSNCELLIQREYVTLLPVTFSVYDAHGGSASQELMLTIWNNGRASATTDSGITVTYEIKYFAKSQFTLNATDAVLSDYENKQLPGYSGTYSAVGAVDYVPGSTFSATDVLEQSMEIRVAKDLGATSLWYVTDAGLWTLISSEASDVNATVQSFEYTLPEDTPVLSRGALVLMSGVLAQEDVPDASITGFSAAAAKGGAIVLNWGVDGTMLGSDSIVITICEGDAGCTDAFTTGLGVGTTTFSYSGSNTVHNAYYNVVVEVCNTVGCSTPKGVGNVTADKSVDGGVSAMNLAVSESNETWIVDWDATGDTYDVASWNVCYQRGTFNAANMPTTCVSTLTTDVVIDKPTAAGTYTYYFTAVPVDALGNTVAAAALNSIDYQRDADTSNVDDGTNVTGETPEGEIPMVAWGMIAGVVIVAFVVGAFILSRGGKDDDENKDWDY